VSSRSWHASCESCAPHLPCGMPHVNHVLLISLVAQHALQGSPGYNMSQDKYPCRSLLEHARSTTWPGFALPHAPEHECSPSWAGPAFPHAPNTCACVFSWVGALICWLRRSGRGRGRGGRGGSGEAAGGEGFAPAPEQ